MALCAQPLGWLTFVEAFITLLLRAADVQKGGRKARPYEGVGPRGTGRGT